MNSCSPTKLHKDKMQLNLTLIPDNYLAEFMLRLAPHNWVLDPDTPHQVSGNLELQGPVVETIVRYAHDEYLPSLDEWLKLNGSN